MRTRVHELQNLYPKIRRDIKNINLITIATMSRKGPILRYVSKNFKKRIQAVKGYLYQTIKINA